MKFANVRTLKANTAALLQAVEAGEEVILTYHGKPKAVLLKISEEEEHKSNKKRQGVLRKDHPFLKLIGKGKDAAVDVSSNKYRYVALAIERKR
jgi:prevent-host-death family protein